MRIKKIRPIIDTIILCGRQGLALRGHNDDSQYHSEVGQYSTSCNVGNFMEILNYRVRGGDTELENHLKNHKKNASYLSRTMQNEIIFCCGEIISDKIVSNIKADKFFSILSDEAIDVSNKPQMSLVLRYVDSGNNIVEVFVKFIHNDNGLDGESLSVNILDTIASIGLDTTNCRGQGYDGAGAVGGTKKGVAARILKLNNKALYTHCFSH
ncbi:52 kDa repressor of the inhibitor of the protein kinase-like [Hydra vulgaris]|uniref:52 kDa repressor of the inhibitor of the protein kinase-like n=1 Tax=Hydra vulgaris TaxID=6087 RepID=A0ABM4B1X8_HYDVU